MAQHTITKRATNVASTGNGWHNVEKSYDESISTYTYISNYSNSACHINGFNFNIPNSARIEKIVVDFRVSTSNSYGYFAGYLYTDTGSNIAYKVFLNKKSQKTPTYFSLEVSSDTIQTTLNSLNVYDKNIITFINSGLRVRWVGGCASDSFDGVECRVYDVKVTVYYILPDYTITVKAGEGGTVRGGGVIESGQTTTLTAIPNSGYKFVKWSDGNTSDSRTITVTGNATYTAYFKLDKIYVTFDSIFNFNKWKDAGITSGNTATISNITDTGFSITANASDSYTNNSHLFTVTPNTDYILEYDAVGNGHEAYVFCDGKVVAGRFWNTTNGVLRFTVPSDCTTIAIRCDSNVSGNTIDYSNIRIYPADYSYMSNSVTATNRSCVNSWNFPTPTRKGYDFLGWNTKPDGSGTTYNSSSTFPKSDLTLYSQWKISKINKIYVGTSQPKSIYVGTSEVKAVYVGTTKVYG